MQREAQIRVPLFVAALLASVFGCNERTQTDGEQCFYRDPGDWIELDSLNAWCDIDDDPQRR